MTNRKKKPPPNNVPKQTNKSWRGRWRRGRKKSAQLKTNENEIIEDQQPIENPSTPGTSDEPKTPSGSGKNTEMSNVNQIFTDPETGVHMYKDLSGTIFEWDGSKRAWFPTVDEKFLADFYEKSYDYVPKPASNPQPEPPGVTPDSEEEKEEAAEKNTKEDKKSESEEELEEGEIPLLEKLDENSKLYQWYPETKPFQVAPWLRKETLEVKPVKRTRKLVQQTSHQFYSLFHRLYFKRQSKLTTIEGTDPEGVPPELLKSLEEKFKDVTEDIEIKEEEPLVVPPLPGLPSATPTAHPAKPIANPNPSLSEGVVVHKDFVPNTLDESMLAPVRHKSSLLTTNSAATDMIRREEELDPYSLFYKTFIEDLEDISLDKVAPNTNLPNGQTIEQYTWDDYSKFFQFYYNQLPSDSEHEYFFANGHLPLDSKYVRFFYSHYYTEDDILEAHAQFSEAEAVKWKKRKREILAVKKKNEFLKNEAKKSESRITAKTTTLAENAIEAMIQTASTKAANHKRTECESKNRATDEKANTKTKTDDSNIDSTCSGKTTKHIENKALSCHQDKSESDTQKSKNTSVNGKTFPENISNDKATGDCSEPDGIKSVQSLVQNDVVTSEKVSAVLSGKCEKEEKTSCDTDEKLMETESKITDANSIDSSFSGKTSDLTPKHVQEEEVEDFDDGTNRTSTEGKDDASDAVTVIEADVKKLSEEESASLDKEKTNCDSMSAPLDEAVADNSKSIDETESQNDCTDETDDKSGSPQVDQVTSNDIQMEQNVDPSDPFKLPDWFVMDSIPDGKDPNTLIRESVEALAEKRVKNQLSWLFEQGMSSTSGCNLSGLRGNDIEQIAVNELMKEAKRRQRNSIGIGVAAWSKPSIHPNKRFLGNLLVSTLRDPIRPRRGGRGYSKNIGDRPQEITSNEDVGKAFDVKKDEVPSSSKLKKEKYTWSSTDSDGDQETKKHSSRNSHERDRRKYDRIRERNSRYNPDRGRYNSISRSPRRWDRARYNGPVRFHRAQYTDQKFWADARDYRNKDWKGSYVKRSERSHQKKKKKKHRKKKSKKRKKDDVTVVSSSDDERRKRKKHKSKDRKQRKAKKQKHSHSETEESEDSSEDSDTDDDDDDDDEDEKSEEEEVTDESEDDTSDDEESNDDADSDEEVDDEDDDENGSEDGEIVEVSDEDDAENESDDDDDNDDNHSNKESNKDNSSDTNNSDSSKSSHRKRKHEHSSSATKHKKKKKKHEHSESHRKHSHKRKKSSESPDHKKHKRHKSRH